LVFASDVGTELDAANVRRAFRKVVAKAGLEAADWTPRELRHSFASLLSDSGVRIEDISRLMGHNGTAVTELVYRHQLRPVIEEGTTAMDKLFGSPTTTERHSRPLSRPGSKKAGLRDSQTGLLPAWAYQDLNLGPLRYQRSALTA